MIGEDFPTIGAVMNPGTIHRISEREDEPSQIPVESTCSCPKHETPPPVPKELPFPDTPENRGRLRDWILDRYA